MAAVLALTVRLSVVPASAGRALQAPSQEVSPVIAAPPRVAWPPVASPGARPARVITCAPGPPPPGASAPGAAAPGAPGPGATIVTAASTAPAPWVLLMTVT